MQKVVLPILFLLIVPTIVWAKEPVPVPRVFVNYIAQGAPCADGTRIHARLVEAQGALWLDRQNCKDRLPVRTSVPLPSGQNAVEKNYLLYQSKVFEDAFENDQHVVLLCATQNTGVLNKSVRAVVRSGSGGEGLNLAVTESPHSNWTAVEAKVEARPSGGVYQGRGNVNKQEFVTLAQSPTSSTATLTYAFEVGTGPVGHRTKTTGSVEKLTCFTP